MKPLTYWLQNEAIEALIEAHGEYLQKLKPELRRELIAYLAAADEWDWSEDVVHPLETIYPIVENLTRHEKDLLIAAIASNLIEQESPWLQGAIKMSAIDRFLKML